MIKRNKGVIFLVILAVVGIVLELFTPKYIEKQKTVLDNIQIETTETIKNPGGQVIIRKTVSKRQTKTESKQVSRPVKKKWLVGLSYAPFTANRVYTLTVDRRIIGGAYVGVYGRTDKEIGITFRLNF